MSHLFMDLRSISSRLYWLSGIGHGFIRVDGEFQLKVVPKGSIQRDLDMTLIGWPDLLIKIMILFEQQIVISWFEVRREVKRDRFEDISTDDPIRVIIVMKDAILCRTV